MSGAVLVLNCGSSSIKYELLRPREGARVARGLVERIGEGSAAVRHVHAGATTSREEALPTHRDALRTVLGLFDEAGPPLAEAGVVAVGHRVVMGGRRFDRPTLIDEEVVATIDRLSPLAPLHNPPNLAGITVARELLPGVPHVAVFDTAFFHDLPPAAATYAIDRATAEAHGIRRYGFHGTSHRWVSRRGPEAIGRGPDGLRQVILHLGNGASASAVVDGAPVDTSMGLTPLEGLVMGTRGGDIDPGVLLHLHRAAGMGVDEIDDLLNRRSGLKGLSGRNDMREVRRLAEAGDADARLALDVAAHRLRKYVGAYAATMGGIDLLAFTGGIGENDAATRAATAEGLGFLGVAVDPARNAAPGDGPRRISPDGAAVDVLVVPTDEELAIALDTMAVVEGAADPATAGAAAAATPPA
ncbi:acetate/propionate family kinase [Miltoncostaea marina]|uniref:acetate/propionate family kinase n=1 Tax=Miltoncostaea marina TaxID=2843215 RepID=UPI001C3CEBE4|nr:acetate kinase [Miltoncostaea marina]